MNRQRQRFLIILLFCLPIPCLQAQLSRYEEMAAMSIEALFDWGGKPTGDWAMKGMPWPVTELQNRDREVVLAEATRRLEAPGKQLYDHAFAVTLLRALDPPELETLLARLYPRLDDAGKYEVLLHAADYGHPAYLPVMIDILNRAAAEQTLDQQAELAAVYALHVYDARLLAALATIVNEYDQLQITFAENFNTLDGFPYSDVVRRSINNHNLLFTEALAFNRDFAELLARSMSDEEQALLEEYQHRLGTVQRIPFSVQPGSLAELLRKMSGSYAWLNFDDISRSIRFSSTDFSLDERTLGYTEVMAELCNHANLDFYSSILAPFSWSVSAHENYQTFDIHNRCVASQGYLFRLYPFLSRLRDTNQLVLSVQPGGPVGWLNPSASFEFHLESIESADPEVQLQLTRNTTRSPTIILELGDKNPESLGALTLRGTALVNIPASISISEYAIVDRDSLEIAEGPLTLHYTRNGEEVQYEWGIQAPECCSFLNRDRRVPVAIGMVQLFSTSGIPQQEIALVGSGTGQVGRLGFKLLDLGNTRVFQPGSLRWIFAPTLRQIEIPVVFENVRFTVKDMQ